MRILAIRGENLASLADKFEIDLMREPLGGAGVFAIVGPTGAGKTTLLDAICVALFDRTPRLGNRSPFQIGRGDDDPTALGAQDVRTLLRRGAIAGWAEVDFESGDGSCYRARWSVRRARGSAAGNLQDQQLTLRALQGSERLGGTKTETLKAIQERLGLTFDQFRRSALLAQGDFAAFLRAEGKDRSELLERMTGTEIYSKLSVAAHQRAAIAEQWLRDCRGAAMAIAVMTDDARGAAELELVAARAASEDVRRRFADAEAYARWLAEAHQRRRALAEAEAEVRSARAAAEQADSLRVELALCRRVELLRDLWTDVRRLESQCSSLRVELGAADVAVDQAAAALGDAVNFQARLAAQYEPIRATRSAARIAEPPPLSSTPTASIVEAAAIAAGDAAVWLTERIGLAAEIVRWPELKKAHAQHDALVEAVTAIDRELERCTSQRRERLAEQKKFADERDLAQRQLAVASGNAERFATDPTLQLEETGRAEDAARQRWEDISQLSAIVAAAQRAAAEHAELVSRQSELERAGARDRQRRAEILRDRDIAIAVRDERTRAVSELRKVAGYAHARTELVRHEPCPLCGSADHPWANRGAVDALLEEAEMGLRAAGANVETATGALAEIDAGQAQRDSERARLTTLRAELGARAQAATTLWCDQLRSAGETAVIEDPGSAAAEALVADRAASARAELEIARQARGQAVAAARAYAEAQVQLQACQSNLEQCESQLRHIGAALAAIDTEVAGYNGERAAKIERQRELKSELDAALFRWTAALPDGAAARHQTDVRMISHLVDEWQQRADQIAVADAALRAALADAEHARAVGERSLVEASARRDELVKRSDLAIRQLAHATAVLDEACSEAGPEEPHPAGRRGKAAGRAAEAARAKTQRWIERDQLEALLGRGSSRIDALAAQLEGITRAVDRAHMRVAERTRLVDDHDQQRPLGVAMADNVLSGAECEGRADVPDPSELPGAMVAAEQRAAELFAQRTAAEQRAAGLAAALIADDEARQRRDAALSAFAAAERAAEIDRVLGEVIGSHDGKLFRSFAQSLTLDSLLAVANAHLEELAPRYQLERVPKHDLELQVLDRDFAGEVRSVQSLSGGECFLASLALALGLSSMTAHDIRVQTLLIDEGFGTLDPATLDGALAVLDELQATGRQVGIISHVPMLLDRVHAHIRVAPRGGGRSRVVTG